MSRQPVENTYARFEIREGVLHCTYKRNICLTPEAAMEIIRQRKEFTNQVPYPLLLRDEGILTISKSAMDVFSSKEGMEGILACALVLETVYNRILGEIFIKRSRPVFPVKIFDDGLEASQWILQFRNPQVQHSDR